MTPLERILAAHLLKLAAEEFSNHCCNDFDLFELMSPEEALKLQQELFEWNGDPEEAPKTPQEARYSQDSFLMRYLANKILAGSEEASD